MAYNPQNPNGQGTMANSSPVVISSDQSTLPVSLASVPSHAVTNAGTFAVQESGAALTSLQLIDDVVTAQGTALGSTKTLLMGGSVATSAPTYTNGNINPLSLTTAGALRVDGSATTQPVSGTVSANEVDVSASGNITTQNLVPAGAATAGSAVEITLTGHGILSIQVTGTYTGALSLQYTIDGTNWITNSSNTFINVNSGAVANTIASAATGIFQADCAGFAKARITGLAAMSGTAVVTLKASTASGIIAIDHSLPAGTATIGAVNIAAAQTLATVTTVSTVTTLSTLTNITNWGNIVDNAAFTDGTTRLSMGGYIFDETAGTALTENDAAAARIDSKRAQVMVVEDATTRGQRQSVNASGGASVTPVPHTAGGLTVYHLVSAGTTNATVVKASAGQLYGWYIYNSNAAARKVAFHNTASAPTAGTSVVWSIVIPPSSGANVEFSHGIPFSTGIAFTTVTGLADSDTTAVAANDLIINLFYK